MTVVVMPRERFSVSLRSLATLLSCTDSPFELCTSMGGRRRQFATGCGRRRPAPASARAYRASPVPNQARNLGLRHVRTLYVVFLDNDVVVTPGWLAPLVSCAEETGAWVVGRLNFEGELDDAEIHNADGFLRFEGPEGRRSLLQDNRYGHRHRSELPADLKRLEVATSNSPARWCAARRSTRWGRGRI